MGLYTISIFSANSSTIDLETGLGSCSAQTKYKNIMETIKINTWPESQVCMECPYGEFVHIDSLGYNVHVCHHPDKEKQDEECFEGKVKNIN